MISGVALAVLLQAGGGEMQAVRGRVLRVEAGDTLPVAGATVLLHRVAATAQGVIDSTRADAAGRYRVAVRPDAGAVLLVSARHQGIEYFAPPVATERGPGAEQIDIVVADISASAPVALAARHLIIGGPAPDGTRDVVDLLVLRNAGTETRAMPDTAEPTWRVALPTSAANVRLGDADFAPELLDLHGDTLFLHAPIPPGDRQLFLEYQIPPGSRSFALPLDQSVAAFSILAEEEALQPGPPLRRTDVQEVDGRRFVRWSGAIAGPGGPLVLDLPGRATAPSWALPALVGVFALLLIGVAVKVALPHTR